MTTDITELAQRMKAAAEKATQGNWRAFKYHDGRCGIGGGHHDEIMVCEHISKRRPHDAEFIALANPANILALVEALEKAQGMEAYWETQCRGITDHCEELQARIAELESHKAALLKFIRDSCYVFDGAGEDISDAYVDAITSGLMPKLESVAACNPPLFWVRVKSDGGYEGPIHDSKLEEVRKKSGEWLPLTLAGGIPELEFRTVTVKLPDYRSTYKGPFADEVEHQVRLALELFSSAAGIKVEAE
ncbi:ead/Ea22-like family protein [Klebsiella michiganensis]